MVQYSYDYISINILRMLLLQTWFVKGKVNTNNIYKSLVYRSHKYSYFHYEVICANGFQEAYRRVNYCDHT